MSSSNAVYGGDNFAIVYEAVNGNVTAGHFIVPDTTAGIHPELQGAAVAGAGALNVIGVAAKSAVPASGQAAYNTGTTSYPDAFFALDNSVPVETFAAYSNAVVEVEYAAGSVAYGDLLKVAASGKATKWVHGTDTDFNTVVGWCAEPGGTAGSVYAKVRVLR